MAARRRRARQNSLKRPAALGLSQPLFLPALPPSPSPATSKKLTSTQSSLIATWSARTVGAQSNIQWSASSIAPPPERAPRATLTPAPWKPGSYHIDHALLIPLSSPVSRPGPCSTVRSPISCAPPCQRAPRPPPARSRGWYDSRHHRAALHAAGGPAVHSTTGKRARRAAARPIAAAHLPRWRSRSPRRRAAACGCHGAAARTARTRSRCCGRIPRSRCGGLRRLTKRRAAAVSLLAAPSLPACCTVFD